MNYGFLNGQQQLEVMRYMDEQIKNLNTIEVLSFRKANKSDSAYRGSVTLTFRGLEFTVSLKKTDDGRAWVDMPNQKKGSSWVPVIKFVDIEDKYAFEDQLFKILKDRKPDEIAQPKGTQRDTSFLD